MIFTFWISDAGPAADAVTIPQSVVAWRENYPSMSMYSDADAIETLHAIAPDAIDLYKRIRIPACKSDLARLLLLYRYGGLYVDSHVGPGDAKQLLFIFSKLAEYDVILFDLSWNHKRDSDVSIMNGVICARKSSPIIKYLIESALDNLRAHEREENEAQGYVPYNIFVLTGAWDIRIKLLDSGNDGTFIKPAFADRLHVQSLKSGEDCGFFLYRHYGYRKEGGHWSERQNSEPLFMPREDAPAPTVPS